MSPEEYRTHDTVDIEPKHYQLSYPGPRKFYVIVIVVIVITFKGTIWDFYNLLFVPQIVSNTYARVASG